MILRRLAIGLAICFCGTIALGIRMAEGSVLRYVDELPCGSVVAKLRTACVEGTSGWRECTSQSLRFADRRQTTRDVPLAIRVMPSTRIPGVMALDGQVAMWACVVSGSGAHYVYLFYSCRPLANDCTSFNPSQEWDQFVNMAGQIASGGRGGNRPAVLRRLGLEKQYRALPPLTDVGHQGGGMENPGNLR